MDSQGCGCRECKTEKINIFLNQIDKYNKSRINLYRDNFLPAVKIGVYDKETNKVTMKDHVIIQRPNLPFSMEAIGRAIERSINDIRSVSRRNKLLIIRRVRA